MPTLEDFFEAIRALKELIDKLKVTFYDKYGNPIYIGVNFDQDGNPYFKFEHEHFQTNIPLEEMIKLAKWLHDIGIKAEDTTKKEELEKKYVKRLKKIHKDLKKGEYDEEVAHQYADEILCDLLKELGFREVVKAWDKIPKWYA